MRSSTKKPSRSRSKSTTAAALARTTRLAPKGKGANDDLKINSRANDTEQLSKGDTVFAAWWNSKKRDQAYTLCFEAVSKQRSLMRRLNLMMLHSIMVNIWLVLISLW